jgi:hypothetical protein
MTTTASNFENSNKIQNESNNVSMHSPCFHSHRNTFIFDGNSQSAHLLARTILVHDRQHLFDLIPKQNTKYFGKYLPIQSEQDEILVLTQDGVILRGEKAIRFVGEQLNLSKIYYH